MKRTAAWRFRHFSAHRGLDPSSIQRKSDVAFILGSGPSINDLDDAAWKEIALYDSFGMNFWLLHPFVPRFYMTEGFRDPNDAACFRKVLAERAEEYRDVTWLIQAQEVVHYLGSPRALFELFPWESDPPLVWLRYRRSLLLKDQKYQRGSFEPLPKGLGGRHPKGFGSVTLAMSIAASMGYREIVLAGVDLDRPGYFWNNESNPHREFRRDLENQPTHKTAQHDKYHPVQDHLKAYAKLVLEPEGRRLSLALPTGLLADDLPAYEFNES